jgi:hypothetical protein
LTRLVFLSVPLALIASAAFITPAAAAVDLRTAPSAVAFVTPLDGLAAATHSLELPRPSHAATQGDHGQLSAKFLQGDKGGGNNTVRGHGKTGHSKPSHHHDPGRS